MVSTVAEIRAITLDLDNTLWDVFPAIERAEVNAFELLRQSYPRVTEQNSFQDIRNLREQLFEAMPEVRHDFTELRRQVYVHLLRKSGYGVDGAEYLLNQFLHDRNQLTLYPDSLPALKRLRDRYPLVSLSDGNSDLVKVGIRDFFIGCVYAADVGFLKPHPAGFLRACEIAETRPEETLHIGDHPEADVEGARNVGMRTMWVRRNNEKWEKEIEPDYSISSMTEAVEILC